MRILIAFVLLVGCCSGSQILVFLTFGTLSHKLSLYPTLELLGTKGHNITVVTIYPAQKQLANVNEIVLPLDIDAAEHDWFAGRKIPKVIELPISFYLFSKVAKTIYDLMMDNAVILEILQSKRVDLVLLDSLFSDFCLPVIHHLKVPFILVSSSVGLPWHFEVMGASADLATVPLSFSATSAEMHFSDRVNNVLLYSYADLLRWLITAPQVEVLAKEHFPNSPSIYDIEKQASLYIVSSNPSFAWPKALPPNVVEIAALHCRSGGHLAEDLKIIADAAGDEGFIVFTLGSFIKMSSMPHDIVEIFFRVFSTIPQTVFMKWEMESLSSKPPNVHLLNWLPQQELIEHPKARLFISHGGLLGIQEALYHAVPVLGLPFSNDQDANINKLSSEGASLRLEWLTFTESTLHEAIQQLLHNKSFTINAERLSSIIRDTPLPGPETATYWIEYVIRQDGARYLKPAGTELLWFQRYLLDVMVFLGCCTIAMVVCMCFLCRSALKLCCAKSAKTEKKD